MTIPTAIPDVPFTSRLRISGWKDKGLPLSFIEVRYKVHGIFIDICQHFHGNLA